MTAVSTVTQNHLTQILVEMIVAVHLSRMLWAVGCRRCKNETGHIQQKPNEWWCSAVVVDRNAHVGLIYSGKMKKAQIRSGNMNYDVG